MSAVKIGDRSFADLPTADVLLAPGEAGAVVHVRAWRVGPGALPLRRSPS